jgi:hypothetical protein
LNCIFGIAVLDDQPWHAVNQSGTVQYSLQDGEATTRGSAGSTSFPRSVFEASSLKTKLEREIISEEKIENYLETSSRIYENQGLRKKIIFVLRAITHHFNEEYSQSYLLSWILLEQHISSMLDRKLEEQGISNNRRDSISDSPHWYASHKIEMLEVSGVIDKDTYTKLNNMRKLRNDVVHEMATVNREDSQEILSMAFELLSDDLPAEDESTREIPRSNLRIPLHK